MTDKQIQHILSAMQGQLLVNPWDDLVPNLYAEGMPCEHLYEQAYCAARRLSMRLGVVEEDADVEVIISSLLEIADIQAREMFRCAWNLASGQRDAQRQAVKQMMQEAEKAVQENSNLEKQIIAFRPKKDIFP